MKKKLKKVVWLDLFDVADKFKVVPSSVEEVEGCGYAAYGNRFFHVFLTEDGQVYSITLGPNDLGEFFRENNWQPAW